MLTERAFNNQLSSLVSFRTTPDRKDTLRESLDYIQTILPKTSHLQRVRDEISPILCRPYTGKNASHQLVQVASELLALFPNSEEPRGERDSTVYIETISGGNSTSKYSAESSMEVVICHPSSVSQKKLVQRVLSHLKKYEKMGVQIEVSATGQSVHTKQRAPAFRLLHQKLKQVRGKNIRKGIQAGGSDARHFHNTDATVLMVKPHGGGIHGEREHISISSSLLLYHALSNFMREYTRQ